VRFY